LNGPVPNSTFQNGHYIYNVTVPSDEAPTTGCGQEMYLEHFVRGSIQATSTGSGGYTRPDSNYDSKQDDYNLYCTIDFVIEEC
jgi:hypothetical protein